MKQVFQAANIACASCANLIKVSLEEKFGGIEVNLETNPKEVSVQIKDITQETEFKKDMLELGFEIIED